MEIKHFALDDIEVKEDGEARTVEGFASVFNNVDSYNDVVLPGAFAKTIKRKKALPMLWQHDSSQVIGTWTEMEERDRGLYVKGSIIDTTMGNDAYKLARAGAVSGMSIGYSAEKYEIDQDKGTRKLTEVKLWEVSLVTFPANEKAQVTRVKAAMQDMQQAAKWLKDAIDLHQQHMDGTEPTTGAAGERSQMRMMRMMKKAYAYLTDAEDMEDMGKSNPQNIREFEEFLREAGYSREAAKIITAKGFKALSGQREAEAEGLSPEQTAEMVALFKGFINQLSA